MRLNEVENIKKFTQNLFAGDAFDKLLVTEASFSTLINVDLDGHINKNFLDEGEENLPDHAEGIVFWKKVKPLCYEIIKGSKPPQHFKIIFKLSSKGTASFVSKSDIDMDPKEINGLFLNINYAEGKLSCTSGVSLKGFTLDKSLENAWDDYMSRFVILLQE